MSTGSNTDLIKFQYDRNLMCLIISNIVPLCIHMQQKLLKHTVTLLKTKRFEHDQHNIYSSKFKCTVKSLFLLLII